MMTLIQPIHRSEIDSSVAGGRLQEEGERSRGGRVDEKVCRMEGGKRRKLEKGASTVRGQNLWKDITISSAFITSLLLLV